MKFSSIFFIGLSIIFFKACQNEESLIGQDFVLNDSHKIFVLPDSLVQISTQSIREDSVNGKGQLSLVGSYNDVYFGSSQSTCVFQLLLPNFDLSFDVSSVENAELLIPFSGFYGDSLAEINFRISALEESLSSIDTTSYYSNQQVLSGLPFYEQSLLLSSLIDNDTLKLIIPSDFLLSNVFSLSNDAFVNNATFTESFYGLKLEANTLGPSPNGAIVYLNTSSNDAKLKVNYSNDDVTEQTINFPIGTESVRLNQFSHTYNDGVFSNLDTLISIQSMGGVFAEIDLAFLSQLQDSGYAVNNAIIEFYVADHTSNIDLPSQLTFVEYDDGQIVSIEGISGGALNEDSQSYQFTITRHIQKILTNNQNTKCRLYTYERTSNADRLVLGKDIRLTLTLIDG